MLSCNRKRWSSYELALNWQQTRCYEVLEGKQQTHLTNPTMHQTNITQCTLLQQKCAHMCTFLLPNGALWDVGLVHCGICVLRSAEKWPWKCVNCKMTALSPLMLEMEYSGFGSPYQISLTPSLVGVLQFYKISFVSFGEYWPLFWRKPPCILQGHVLIWAPELQPRWSHISWRHGVCGTCPTWSRRSRSTASCLPASWSNYGCAATPRWNKSKR